MTVTTALYRRYRPDSFADVIGQEHVTEPLMTALRKNRVNHAYLFSGPRGCGKTTSARILARCLNCAEGPTDTPCGKCNSCVELARGGSGSLDVIEIDAASHGGVDDARDLRERATFAPVRDRYKIFIIDEAHMVTSAGFNALLKIVEEPPEHIKFIFATTEPDKVIGTIRSRTHHYPFRLVPPEPLMAYLEQLCAAENVPVAPGVLSLVIRAGGGSVRDTLSVLDQLMAGAGAGGLDYELAVALLGYTHASLLDDVVEAVAAGDSATVFRAVDRVIQTGHDPRRFVEDLLERFRDLIIVQAMPESAHAILRGMPEDQIARMKNQASTLGAAELSRAADVTNTALTEMTGATSPRLHLELLCARILLPSAEQSERGIAARIERVERRLSYGSALPAGESAPAVPAPQSAASVPHPSSAPRTTPEPAAAPSAPAASPAAVVPPAVPEPAPAQAAPAQAAPAQAAPAQAAPAPVDPVQAAPSISAPRVSTSDWPTEDNPGTAASRGPEATPGQQPAVPRQAPERTTGPDQGPAQAPAAQAPAAQPQVPAAGGAAPAAGGADVEVVRRAWPEILQTLTKIKRSSWALVGANAQVARFDGQTLVLSFSTDGLASAFSRADHAENLRQAIHKTIGIDCQVNAIAGGNSSGSSAPNPKAPASQAAPAPIPAAAPVAPAAASPAAEVSAVDTAWGLAPAGSSGAAPASEAGPASPAVPDARETADSPAVGSVPSGAPAVAQGAASSEEAAASSKQTAAPTVQTPSAVPTPSDAPVPPAVPAAAVQPESGTAPQASEDYSYSDDDWGPPRDEDAPPMDEEPPMDWVPPSDGWQQSPGPGNPVPAPAAPAASRPEAERPATTTPSAVPSDPGSTDTVAQNNTSDDPWSRAVEQSPGSWVVGSSSNVGSSAPVSSTPPAPTESGAAANPAGNPTGTPAYEPAAAQLPAQQATAQPTTAQQYPAQQVPAQQAPAQAPAPAAQAETQASTWATVPAQPVPEPSGNSGSKQSLYQRLSNSPEAIAGRQQVPARAATATATMVEDIPSADDETIEESGVFGRAAVERILGGRLLEERSLDGTPLMRR